MGHPSVDTRSGEPRTPDPDPWTVDRNILGHNKLSGLIIAHFVSTWSFFSVNQSNIVSIYWMKNTTISFQQVIICQDRGSAAELEVAITLFRWSSQCCKTRKSSRRRAGRGRGPWRCSSSSSSPASSQTSPWSAPSAGPTHSGSPKKMWKCSNNFSDGHSLSSWSKVHACTINLFCLQYLRSWDFMICYEIFHLFSCALASPIHHSACHLVQHFWK